MLAYRVSTTLAYGVADISQFKKVWDADPEIGGGHRNALNLMVIVADKNDFILTMMVCVLLWEMA